MMPTVFGLLNFSYQSKFLGQDVFKPEFQPKAYCNLSGSWFCEEQSPDHYFSGEESQTILLI
jgi:hypothetical protein